MTLCVVRTPQIRSCLAAVEGHPRLLADRLAGVLSRGARQSLRVRHIYGLSAQEHSRSDHRVGVHCLRHHLPEGKNGLELRSIVCAADRRGGGGVRFQTQPGCRLMWRLVQRPLLSAL